MNDYLSDVKIRELAQQQYPLIPAAREFRANNPLCGDKILFTLQIEDNYITNCGYDVKGCLLARAAAAILAKNIQGETIDSLKAQEQELRKMLKGEGEILASKWQELTIFKACIGNRSRHECILLPFRALKL